MKNNFYLKHSLMAMHDPRMSLLMDTEGPKGVGVYWMIMENLVLFPNECARVKDVCLYLKGCKVSAAYVKRIIFGYQLFDLYEEDYIAAAELNPSKQRRQKAIKPKEEESVPAETVCNESEKIQESEVASTVRNECDDRGVSTMTDENKTVLSAKKHTEQCSLNNENRIKIDHFKTSNDAKIIENCKKTMILSSEVIHPRRANSLIINELEKINSGIKENIRDIITTTTEKKEKEKKDAVVDAAAVVDDEIQNSGNFRKHSLPRMDVVAGGEESNFRRKAIRESAVCWVDNAFEAGDTYCKPALEQGKCHTQGGK